jgi:hypothetical protein
LAECSGNDCTRPQEKFLVAPNHCGLHCSYRCYWSILFTNNTPSTSADARNLTASAVTVGTTTSSVSSVNTSPISASISAPATRVSDDHTNNNLTQQNQSPQVAAQASTKHPRRGKKLKPMDERSEADQTVRTQTGTEITVINGKTFTTGFNTNHKKVESAKTKAYIDHAAQDQKSFLALEGGINWSNPQPSFSSFNTQIGLRYYRYISPKIALSTGLTYARIHQHLPARSYANTDYDFGKKASAIRITTQRLDYIELPVSVLYQFKPKHSITAGIAVGYVIQSSDKVEDQTIGTVSNQHGYLTAINRWDTQLMLGYQYQLTPSVWMRTSCHMGLMDISNNAAFKQSETHTNKGLRLTLGYKIF